MSNRLNLVFLGSKQIGVQCLDFLIQNKDVLGVNIIGVLTKRNKVFDREISVEDLAVREEIPVYESLWEIKSKVDIHILVSVQYHKILKESEINLAKNIAVNLHMAPLPEYRGCNQFSFAIFNNSPVFGATIHVMDPGIDSGDILFEERFKIPENCDVEQLYQLTFQAAVKTFKENINKVIAGDFRRIPQKSLLSERGTKIYYRKDIEKLKEIKLSEEVKRQIRATSMPGFEPPFAFDGSNKIYFVKEKTFNELKSD